MTATDLLFVYGTLRSQGGHPMASVLAAGGERVGPGTMTGTLLCIDWYPGLVLTPGPARVLGELWQVREASVWPQIDRYEECSPEDPKPHEYARQRLGVDSETLGSVLAWVYVYMGSTVGRTVIEHGDWLDYARSVSR